MSGRSTVVILAALLALAGCGSHSSAKPLTGDALAASIRARGGLFDAPSPAAAVGCVGHACTVSLQGRFDTAQVAWLNVGGVVWSIEGDTEDGEYSVDHLTVLLGDPDYHRVAVFTCNPGNGLKVPSQIDFGTTPPRRLRCATKMLTGA